MGTGAELRESLAELRGLKLGNVEFGPFHVQLKFTGEWNVSVQIDKAFQLQTSSGSQTFDVAQKVGEGSGVLMRLIGREARSLSYEPNSFTVSFDNGTSLVVPLGSDDFDPVQVYCAHHMSPRELAWGFTVNANM